MTEAPKPVSPVAAPDSPRRVSSVVLRPLTDGQKEALTIQALGLLNQQVPASPAQSPDAAVTSSRPSSPPPAELTELQTSLLGQLLPRFFARQFKLALGASQPLGKRLAQLFFASDLFDKTATAEDKVVRHPEQGVHSVLQRYKHRLRAELDGLEYESPELRAATIELFNQQEQELGLSALARRSPELTRLLGLYSSALDEFLQSYLPPRLEQLSRSTIRVCRSARRVGPLGYPLPADAFGDFRAEWERLFMSELVFFCGDALPLRLSQLGDTQREARLKLLTDPRVFSETCAVICQSLYDFLGQEGFLTLPG